MTREEEIIKSNNAERLMKELEPYFEMVEDAITDKWKQSPVTDTEGQAKLRLMLKLLGDLQANINETIQTGKMAKIQLEADQKVSWFQKLAK